MEDDLGPPRLEDVGDRSGIRDVGLHQLGALDERVVEVLASPGRQVVDHDDGVAPIDQCVDQVGADEAGPAGYQSLHGMGQLIDRR